MRALSDQVRILREELLAAKMQGSQPSVVRGDLFVAKEAYISGPPEVGSSGPKLTLLSGKSPISPLAAQSVMQQVSTTPPRSPPRVESPTLISRDIGLPATPTILTREFRIVRSTTPPRSTAPPRSTTPPRSATPPRSTTPPRYTPPPPSTTPRSVVTTPQLRSRDLLSRTSSPGPPLAYSVTRNSPWSRSQHSRSPSPSGAYAGVGTASNSATFLPQPIPSQAIAYRLSQVGAASRTASPSAGYRSVFEK